MFSRKHATFVAWVLCCLTACERSESSKPENIFGMDNRELVTTMDFPYSAMGSLATGCSATLVGRRLVLTAAHCVYDPSASAIKTDLKYFSPWTPTGSTPVAPVGIDHVWYGSNQPETDRGKDWAVLLLQSPLGDQRRWLTVSNVDVTSRLPYTVSLAGFNHDINGGTSLSVIKSCQIRKANGDRLLNDCDSKAGISGGSMYVLNGSSASVVAIAVSEYRQGATDSVTVPDYSDNYANVAISSAAAANVISQLQNADAGGTIPSSVNGALSAHNPNAPTPVVTPTPTPPPGPTPTPTPIPGPTTFDQKLTQLSATDADLSQTAVTVGSLANRAGDFELLRWSQMLQEATAGVASTITNYRTGATSIVQLQNLLYSYGSDVQNYGRFTLSELRACGPGCNGGDPYLESRLSQQLESLRQQIAGLGL